MWRKLSDVEEVKHGISSSVSVMTVIDTDCTFDSLVLTSLPELHAIVAVKC
jgi:hypothetical protein